MQKKRAVAYIGGPRQLQDFIWYYLANGKVYTWDLVCQPMYKEMGLEKICRQSGLFEEIYLPDSFLTRPRNELIKIGVEMVFCWLAGRNKQYARHEIAKFMDLNQYSHMCLSTTRGVTCGLMALAADEAISIDLLEDGQGDNTDAHAKMEIKRWREPFYLVSWFFAKMGYCNPNGMFPLKSMKRCCRYSAEPDCLSVELYKEVHRLYDMTLIDTAEYEELKNKTFGEAADFSEAQAVLFTTNMKDFAPNPEYYVQKIGSYFETEGYGKVAVKKHPRDLNSYNIHNGQIIMLSPMIPGENIVGMIKKQKIFFMYPSTTLTAFENKHIEISIFLFLELKDNAYYMSHFEKGFSIVREISGITLKIIEI